MKTTIKSTPEVLWNLQFILIGIISLIINGFNAMQMTILPLYVQEISGSALIAGLMTTAFTVTAFLFRFPAGKLLNRTGIAGSLLIGLAVCTAATAVFGILTVIPLLLLLRLIYGAGFSYCSTAIGKAAADNIPKSRLMEGIGFIGLFGGLAASLGTSTALAVSGSLGYTPFFTVSVAVIFLGLVLSAVLIRRQARKPADNRLAAPSLPAADTGVRQAGAGILEKKALPAAILLLLLMLGQCATTTFVAPYCKELGFGDISLYFLISAGASILIRLFSGKIADRHGTGIVIIPGILLFALNFLFLAYVPSRTFLYLIGFLYGAVGGILLPTIQGILVLQCPGRSGTANALYYAAIDAGFGVGGFLWGSTVQFLGYRPTFLISAACILAGLFVYLLFVANRVPAASKAQTNLAQ